MMLPHSDHDVARLPVVALELLLEKRIHGVTPTLTRTPAMVIAKSLERIGDHAKNVAEEVVYLCEALDIRHPSALKAVIPPAGS